MTQNTILLFDLDGVLVRPHGYQHALSDTVGLIGAALGYADVRLSPQLIDRIEAAGLTSEWDSSAVCTALMLVHAWSHVPDLRLPQMLPLEPASEPHLPAPDFEAFINAVDQLKDDRHARERAAQLLLKGTHLTDDQRQTLQAILDGARDPQRSLGFHVFQEMVLGSERYSETYHRPAQLQTESYLISDDRPALALQDLGRLRKWIAVPGQDASIFTNRPTPWPDGKGGTPEAQLGAHVGGLDSLPIVGYGELTWWSARSGRAMEALIKPSPVHALAALLSARDLDPAAAVETADRLVSAGENGNMWHPLEGAHVFVFEDSASGLISAQTAKGRLASIGVPVELQLCGITLGSAKQAALQATGARLFSSIGEALRIVPDF